MIEQLAHYIDALIPGMLGVLLVAFPGLFTKAQGDALIGAKERLRRIGGMLLIIAAVFAAMTLAKTF